jgi:hypothetical protein
LLYCQEEVEAQYAEWLEARVGASDTEAASPAPEEENQTFSRAAVMEHLERCRLALLETLDQRRQMGEDDLSEALCRAATLLQEVRQDFESSTEADTRRLEDSLTGLERMLSDAVRSLVSSEQLEMLRKELTQQLKPYRAHMEKAVYEQTLENLLLKRLREQCSVPRLSLFYL